MFKKAIEKHPVLTVLLFMAVTLTPMMAMRDYSPSNELRYLSIADEALSDGNIFAFTNQGEHYADKPPLYFWLIMLCKLLFGKHSMFVLSLFSFIPACVIIAIMDKWITAALPGCFNAEERAGAALLAATCGLFLGMSVFLRMDMLMCMWIVLALWTFWKMDNGIGNIKVQHWLLPLYIFLALFTKGPVGLLAPPLAISVYLICDRRPKDIFKYLGIKTWGLIAGLCLVWFIGVWFDGGKEYLNNLLFHQTVGRAVNSFHHKAPLWQYCILIWEVMAPWCLLTVPCAVLALCGKAEKKPLKVEKFFALTVITIFLMLSCFSSKLAIYLAPVFPFLAYCFPVVVKRRCWNGWFGAALAIPALLFIIIGAAALIVSLVCIIFKSVPELINYPFLRSPMILLAGLIGIAGGAIALHSLAKYKGQWEKPVKAMAMSLLLFIFAVSFEMPRINDFVGYGNLCKLIPEGNDVYTLSVHRPENMDVYLGRDIYDFGKDAESFLMIAPKKGSLVVSISFLSKNPEVMEYLEGLDFEFCGNYAIYNLDLEETSKSKIKINKVTKKSRKDS